MTAEILTTIGKVILFFIASYFLFYKSFLKKLGEEVGKLYTAKDLTTITEEVKQEFNESIESYKSKLSEELSLKIEPLKAELDKQNISHQIQYSFLHEKRGEVIVELYQKLQELYSAMGTWTAIMNPVIQDANKEAKERAIRANSALTDFRNYFILNKLFFSKDFCKSIEKLIDIYWNKAWDFDYAQKRILTNGITDEYFKEYSMKLREISDELRKEIPPMISEIEDLCREILNVQNQDKDL